ncbi:alpha/beta hydrolase fold-domain-containing protein [Xylariales sp. PMI_506]|nr:alpha/beta hydrolase fold-domain-containing protein [Xylariales sp. PMI_506]
MSVQQDIETREQPPYPLHPSVLGRIDPEYAAYYNEYVQHRQQTHLQPIEVSRAGGGGPPIPGTGPLVPVGQVRDFHVPRSASAAAAAAAGATTLTRAFVPHGEAPEAGWSVCIWIHGGGWVTGDIDGEAVVARRLCVNANCVVITLEYRLAPENPFPAAIDDCWDVFLWTLDQGKTSLSLDTSKLAIGGSSAGGNLAAAVVQRATADPEVARRGGRIVLQMLSVPVLDNTVDETTGDACPSWRDNQFTPALSAKKMRWFRDRYLPDASDWRRPEASPLLWEGDWSTLPPAVLVLGGIDVLLSEGEQYAARLRAAGVAADVHVMPGQPHPFIALDGVLEAGREAIRILSESLAAKVKEIS